MFLKKIILLLFFTFFNSVSFAQRDSVNVKNVQVKGGLFVAEGKYDALAPSKAAFYSAIFPGMGQVYNKKYWKAPIVWAALAIPTYYYLGNNKEYERYRAAYRIRKNGGIDEFTINGEETISIETLETAQKQLRENRDLSLLSGIILYVLQIVEASVNAHLLQFNTDDNLSFRPSFILDPATIKMPSVGLTLKYNF